MKDHASVTHTGPGPPGEGPSTGEAKQDRRKRFQQGVAVLICYRSEAVMTVWPENEIFGVVRDLATPLCGPGCVGDHVVVVGGRVKTLTPAARIVSQQAARGKGVVIVCCPYCRDEHAHQQQGANVHESRCGRGYYRLVEGRR